MRNSGIATVLWCSLVAACAPAAMDRALSMGEWMFSSGHGCHMFAPNNAWSNKVHCYKHRLPCSTPLHILCWACFMKWLLLVDGGASLLYW